MDGCAGFRTLRVGNDPTLPSTIIVEQDILGACKEFLDARPVRNAAAAAAKNDSPPPAVSVADFISSAVNFGLNRQQQQQQQQSTSPSVSIITDEDEQIDQDVNSELDSKKKELEDLLKKQQDDAHREAIRKELQRLEELKRAIEPAKAEEKRKLLERERKREEIRRKLASIGICPAGYVWHRQGSGFRCGGGSHFASFSQLGLSEADVSDAFGSSL